MCSVECKQNCKGMCSVEFKQNCKSMCSVEFTQNCKGMCMCSVENYVVLLLFALFGRWYQKAMIDGYINRFNHPTS
jgi:hypothetical protein